MWYVVVTMTTIGYGDVVAKTIMARVIVMILVIWGNFWNSIFLSSIYPYIQQNIQEIKAYNLINRLRIRQTIKELSAKIVTNFIIISHLSKDPKNTKLIKKKNLKILNFIKEIRIKKKELISILYETQYFVDDIFLDLESLTVATEIHLTKAEKILSFFTYITDLLRKKIYNKDCDE